MPRGPEPEAPFGKGGGRAHFPGAGLLVPVNAFDIVTVSAVLG